MGTQLAYRHKKYWNIRYIRSVTLSLLCALFPPLRKVFHFYNRCVLIENVPGTVISDTTHTTPITFTKEEHDFMHASQDSENITDEIKERRIIRVLKDTSLYAPAGTLIYQSNTIHAGKEPPHYNNIKPALHIQKLSKEDDYLWLPLVGVHKGYRHFGHFFIDYLAELFYALKALPENTPIRVITRENLPGFMQQAYDYITRHYPHVSFVAMPDNQIWHLPRAVHVERLYNASKLYFDTEYIEFLRKAFATDQNVAPAKETAGNRHYISRGDVPKRGVANEKQLVSILEEHGFDVIHPTHLSLKEQIQLYSDSEAIIAPGGSAMLNLLYVRPSTKVRIFYPESQVAGDFLWFCKSLGISDHIHIIVGDIKGKNRNYHISTDAIHRALTGLV